MNRLKCLLLLDDLREAKIDLETLMQEVTQNAEERRLKRDLGTDDPVLFRIT
jgi:hypothetical protein